jgi:type I restriction enzyme S subunit
MSWDKVPFESLYAIPSRNGLTRPERVRGNGYKMINMGELFAYDRIGAIDMELVPMNERELDNMLVEEGDLLFARQSLVFSGAGKCSLIVSVPEQTTFESHIIRVRLKKELANPAFYFYYFKSASCGIRSIVTQGVQSGIRGNDLKTLPVHLPTIDVQDKIVDILNNYNDLIENNRRRIQLLEESARLLYREWFVHLRFSSHEHSKIVDGVPDGWELTTASAVMDVLSGGTPKTTVHEYWDGEIPFFTPRDTTDCAFTYSTEKTITEIGLAKCNSRLYPKYTVFITARGTVGKLSLAQRPMAMNQSCYALIAKDNISQQFLYCSLKASIEQFKARASGSVFDSIVVDTFKQIPFLKPSETLLEEFTEFALKVFEQVDKLSMTNIKLGEARDLLLPRLMNGEIDV